MQQTMTTRWQNAPVDAPPEPPPQVVRCKSCNQRFILPDHDVPQPANCPHCGASTVTATVPSLASPELAPNSTPSRTNSNGIASSAKAAPTERTQGIQRPMVISGVIASVFIGLILFAVLWSSRGVKEIAPVPDESQSLVGILKEEAIRMQAEVDQTKQRIESQKRRNSELMNELNVLQLEVSKLEQETAL